MVIIEVAAEGTMMIGLGEDFFRCVSGVITGVAVSGADLFAASGFEPPRYELIVLIPKSVTESKSSTNGP